MQELANVLDSRFFKVLGEPVRVEILKLLIQVGRADIGAVAERLPQDRSVISRHLSIMAEARLLSSEKVGRHIFYEVDGIFILQKLEGIVDDVRAYFHACCPELLDRQRRDETKTARKPAGTSPKGQNA